jgi:exodeoxyribonuclease V gamma subunit
VRRARAPQPVGDWAALVGDVLAALVDDAPALVMHRRAVQDAARRLVDEAGPCAIPLDLAAVRLLLEARLDEAEGGGGGAGAITLAALAPGRVVPARVVALLGVDEARFPRPRAAAGFDLLAGGDVPGAADAPAEDRLRVLEALLAARDRLLVVYTGRTVDTNDQVAPAVPVGELLDAIDARCVRADRARDADGHALPARTLVVRAHALQPFSPHAFDAGAPESHDVVHLAGARALRAARRPAPDFLTRPLPPADGDAPRVVTVDDLADFLAAPARTLVARRLGVRFDAPAELPVDDPLALDALERHGVRDALLRRLLDAPDLDAFDAGRALALLRADGALPHGPLGALAFEREYADARAVAAPVRRWRARRACDAATVDRVIGAWRLVGRVGPVWYGGDDAWGPGLREAQPGKLRAKHQAALWVRHLALHLAPELAGEAPTSALASRPGGDGRPRHVCVVGAVADAERCLADLLALYDAGTRGPVAYAPAASLAYAEAFDGKRTESDAHDTGLRDAARAWAPDFGVGELTGDAYLTRLFGDEDVTERDDFAGRAQRVWAPFVRARVLRGDA